MNLLPKYLSSDTGQFDFRIYDGLGSYLEPDWEDPALKVEFYDSSGALKFSATKNSQPPLTSAQDAQGVFLLVAGIKLESFASGVVFARIYCKVNNTEVVPYPTIMPAFQVISGLGSEPVYTLVEKVKAELPREIPSQLTDQIVEQFIYDASRRIDAFLLGFYPVPFPGIEQSPQTPAVIERLCRKLALADCLFFLGTANQIELQIPSEEKIIAELNRLRKGEVQLPGFEPASSVYQGLLYQEEFSLDLPNPERR